MLVFPIDEINLGTSGELTLETLFVNSSMNFAALGMADASWFLANAIIISKAGLSQSMRQCDSSQPLKTLKTRSRTTPAIASVLSLIYSKRSIRL